MPDSGPVRILLVDDHSLYRQGLRSALSGQPGLTIDGEASSGREALALFRLLEPDMVVLDIHLPDMTGLEVATQMLRRRPSVRIAMLTMLRDEEVFNAALRLGALGYVLKECAADEIIDCISAVVRGEAFVSRQLAPLLQRRRVLADTAGMQESPVQRLTTAERRVLRLLGASRSSAEIARELRVSAHVIEAHCDRIAGKLGLESAGLQQYALAAAPHLDMLD